MSAITTHVLDTAAGRPAAGIPVTLQFEDAGTWRELARGVTDSDGRLRTLLSDDHVLIAGDYRLTFETVTRSAFYPRVIIDFKILDPREHFHVPLLLSPYGYSTYRGS